MLFTWVPGFGRHILWQFAKGWFYFLLGLIVFAFLPDFVQMVCGKAPGDIGFLVYPVHAGLFVGCLLRQIIEYEIDAIRYRRMSTSYPISVDFVETVVANVISKAGLRRKPGIVVTTGGAMPVAISAGLFSKFWILISWESIDTMLRQRLEAVLAHEVAHIAHLDHVMHIIRLSIAKTLEIEIYALLAIFFVGYGVGLFSLSEIFFLLKTVLLVVFVFIGYELAMTIYVRTREYLADVAPAKKTFAHRDNLIWGIVDIIVMSPMTKEAKRKHLIGKESWIDRALSIHPSTSERARALRVDLFQKTDLVLSSRK